MAKSSSSEPKKAAKPTDAVAKVDIRQREMRGEMAGIVLLFAGVGFAVSLLTHDPRDMASVAAGKGAEHIANLLGPVGARMADLLLHFFGLGAFLLNALVLALAFATLTGKMRAPRLALAVGALGASLSALVLLHLVAQRVGWRPMGKEAAGLLPGAVAMVLKAMFKTTGTAMLAGCTFLAALAVMSGRSLTSMFVRWVSRQAAPVVGKAASTTKDAAKNGWQQLNDTMRQRATRPAVTAGTVEPGAEPTAPAQGLSDLELTDAWLGGADDGGREVHFTAGDLMAPLSGAEAAAPELSATAVSRPPARAADPLPTQPVTAPALRVPPMVGAPTADVAAGELRTTMPYNPADRTPAGRGEAVGPTCRMNAVELGQALTDLDSVLAGDDPEISAAFVMPVVDDRMADEPPPPPGSGHSALRPASMADGPSAHEGPRIVATEALRGAPAGQPIEAVQQSLALDTKVWVLPPSTLLQEAPHQGLNLDEKAQAVLHENAEILTQKLKDFGILGDVAHILPGPVVTTYEFKPAAGVKISKIVSLRDDLTMSLSALGVRVVAPVPGRDVVGIEVPNKQRQTVYFREVLERQEFRDSKGALALILGKDIEGRPMTLDLAKAPHMLVAGATGTGKSVGVNSFISSLLFRCTPDDLKLILVDPKILELSLYEGIPHLLLPVLDEARKAELALKWACKEMDRRYRLMANVEARNLAGYKAMLPDLRQQALRKANMPVAEGAPPVVVEMPEDPPYIVIVIDEFADLLAVSGKEIEVPVGRLAAKARAAGIHVILATQRPSIDVITGVIKANFPTRVSFKVASSIDSKVVLNCVGAETLLGNGDMLVVPPGEGMVRRCHGTWISEKEVSALAKHWKDQGAPCFEMAILKDPDAETDESEDDAAVDELYDDAVRVVVEAGQASVSFLQRKLAIGYGRAAKLIDKMERRGLVGPSRGPNKPREVVGDR
ncbi:MAG: DNA translocase FtsK 4TM domain-containing protein [Deltaproteobacteria bacterium]|nr:DNA translocase FtsK 4TM domain-containing protein [Deltaproteobacteria bacterium]